MSAGVSFLDPCLAPLEAGAWVQLRPWLRFAYRAAFSAARLVRQPASA